VLRARAEPAAASQALEALCRTYWPPLYTFLRCQGYAPDDAADAVQGFFERFLARDSLQAVSPEKGRFRSFLLASLRHYTANLRRDRRAARRGGGAVHVALDDPDPGARCEAALQTAARPEAAFDRVWAQTVMETAARRLRSEYVDDGRRELHERLRGWLAREARPGDYAVPAHALGMSEGAVAVAVHRLRHRFRELVRAEVAHTVQAPAEIDAEMRYLLEVLTTP
jgi:RNA polymerase sigma-70 factor (ECF subfamily)